MKSRGQREDGFEDATLLALKMGEWGQTQGMQATLRSWKRQGKGLCPRGTQPASILILAQ